MAVASLSSKGAYNGLDVPVVTGATLSYGLALGLLDAVAIIIVMRRMEVREKQ